MNQQRLKMAYLFVWAMILGFSLPSPSMAQEAAPIPKITPLWTVTGNFCPPDVRCGQMWRLSADGEHLFLYVDPPSTMYVFSKGTDKVVIYPNIEFHEKVWLDYFPVDDHTILYPDFIEGGILMRLDLVTGESHAFGIERGLKTCLSRDAIYSFAPPFTAVHYLPTTHALLVCRIALDGSKDPIISTVDLKSGAITDVVRMPDGDYLNVVGGRDGFVYAEPGLSSYWSFISNYSERRGSFRSIERWNSAASAWDTIETPSIPISGDKDWHFQRFMGVDDLSNLYYQNYYYEGEDLKLKITEIDSDGKIVRVMKGNQLGWNPELIGLDATGEMIILNRMSVPSANATVEVDVISRYEFDTPSPAD